MSSTFLCHRPISEPQVLANVASLFFYNFILPHLMTRFTFSREQFVRSYNLSELILCCNTGNQICFAPELARRFFPFPIVTQYLNNCFQTILSVPANFKKT